MMGEAAAKEPSMEDILSSIRKIISEEGNEAAGLQAEAPNAQPAETASADATQADVAEPEASDSAEDKTLANLAEEMLDPIPEDAASVESEPVQQSAPAGGGMSLSKIAEMAKENPQPVAAQAVASEQPHAGPQSNGEANNAKGVLAQIAANVKSKEEAASQAATAQQPEVAAAPTAVSNEIEVEIDQVAVAAQQKPPVKAASPATPAVSQAAMEAEFKGALVSPSTDSAVNDSFERLKRSAMDDIEAKTEAILRPMLREWLDNNLPSMVERLVREEIERVSRGI